MNLFHKHAGMRYTEIQRVLKVDLLAQGLPIEWGWVKVRGELLLNFNV